MWYRRARGLFLRLVSRRAPAAIAGVGLVAGAVTMVIADWRWESWLTDGLSLVLGGTGGAIFLFAVGPRRSDWFDPD